MKVKNAGELLWESLDAQERQLMLYLLAYALAWLAAAYAKASRERLKRELREEMTGAAALPA